MDANPSTDTDDTYIFDEDVMEEMENLEATVVLPETLGEFGDFDTQDDDFLDDIGATTVALSDQSYLFR